MDTGKNLISSTPLKSPPAKYMQDERPFKRGRPWGKFLSPQTPSKINRDLKPRFVETSEEDLHGNKACAMPKAGLGDGMILISACF
jgi:hypothetical protein